MDTKQATHPSVQAGRSLPHLFTNAGLLGAFCHDFAKNSFSRDDNARCKHKPCTCRGLMCLLEGLLQRGCGSIES